MVRFLLAPGANPNDPNSWGQTPIVAAATRCSRAVDPAQVAPGQQEQFEVVHEQGRAGATLAIPDTAGLRPLAQRLASCCGHTPHSETQRRICEVFGL